MARGIPHQKYMANEHRETSQFDPLKEGKVEEHPLLGETSILKYTLISN